MEDIEVEETLVVSDISEGTSSGDDSGVSGGLLPELITGVRNGRPPPFVTKLYDVVSDKATDSTISWVSSLNVAQMENQVSSGATSFVILNEVDFVSNVLPLMSKSNKFDSFISQLNNYGFKKVSMDRREYANKWFQEGKPYLLKNIKRRNKETKSESEKLTREIEKIESESKKVDCELLAFKTYIDNTISEQKKVLQAIANAIKSTFDLHRSHEEVVNSDNATHSTALVGQQSHEKSELGETSELGELSFVFSCEMPTEKVKTN